MEMQDVPREEQKDGDERASELIMEVKTEEGGENDLYAKLQNPSEDVYEETHGRASVKKTGKQSEGNVGRYHAACLLLAAICLGLLLAVIILSMRLKSESTVCPENVGIATGSKIRPSFDGECSLQMCQAMLPAPQDCPCQQCPRGWLLFGSSCFFFSTLKKDWKESQQNCTSRGGSLAVVTSQKLQTFLVESDTRQFWIGLTQLGNNWMWVNNDVMQTGFWATDRHQGKCGVLRGRREPERNWIQVPCEMSTYFICQKSLKCHLSN